MNFRIAIALLAAVTASDSVDALPHVHPDVHRTLRKQGTVNLLVTLSASTESTLESFKETEFESRSAQIESLKEQLETHHKNASAEVETLLGQERSADLHGGYKSFWISSQVVISTASFELVEKLAGLRSIASIREGVVAKVDWLFDLGSVDSSKENILRSSSAQQQASENSWGVDKIGAPQVWAEGFNGQGVVVASIDGGVRWTHEALKDNFRGAYGWYDPELKAAEPYDVDGHGTHTMGTIAGSKGIGVAPGVKWMACKGCRVDDCTDADLLECAQFVLCPTDTQGQNADCSKAPRIVSNSWSSPGGDDWYKAAVDAWVAAGIIPVFSQGNTGPNCSTVRSPGDYANVIAVGASTPDEELAYFSSRGPSVWGGVKPEISAPGWAVRSAYGTGDSDYLESYGTSMATPHVTGAIALVLSSQPKYTTVDVKCVLLRTAKTTTLVATNDTCGDTSDAELPNNQWGHGRLDAYAAVLNLYYLLPTTEQDGAFC
ncbi:hypothetical protein Gpo141_00011879 [Globisporangium polare]